MGRGRSQDGAHEVRVCDVSGWVGGGGGGEERGVPHAVLGWVRGVNQGGAHPPPWLNRIPQATSTCAPPHTRARLQLQPRDSAQG